MTRALTLLVCLAPTIVAVPRAPLHAQAPAAGARFEVASVKRSDPNAGNTPIGPIPMVLPTPGGRLTATNVPLRMLVRLAHETPDFRVDGGPAWLTTERFDITAKAEEPFTGTIRDLYPMLKTLLADRFALKTHIETRELPTYSLVVARDDGKLGAGLKPSASQCGDLSQETQKRIDDALKGGGLNALAGLMPKPGETLRCSLMPSAATGGAVGLKADGLPLSLLAQLLTEITGRTVNDRTGLKGLYDWEIAFDPEVLLRMAAGQGVNIPPALLALMKSTAPSLFTALHEQLGLELDSDRGPVEVLVIDSAEMPTPD